MGIFHIGRELGNQGEVAAMRLLRLGLRIGHMGGHSPFALAPVPGVVDFVAKFAALGVAVLSCHNDLFSCTITHKVVFYFLGVGPIPLSRDGLALPIL